MRSLCAIVIVALLSAACRGETVSVKYLGALDLSGYTCTTITRRSFIRRVCYEGIAKSMVIELGLTYYAYCDLGPETEKALMAADSMGRYYNSSIKGRFSCRQK